MKKAIFVAALCAFNFCSCKKSATTNNEGNIRFTNTSKTPYEIYVDEVDEGIVSAESSREVKKNKGRHNLKALELDGHLVYQKQATLSVDIKAGENIEFVFP